MKGFREFSNIIIGFLLFVFILAFTMGISIKGFVRNDLLGEPVKDFIVKEYSTDEYNNENQAEKQLILSIIKDDDSDDIVNLVIDNYVKYNQNTSYELSEKDAETFREFMIKYKDKIITAYNTESKPFTETEFNESISYEKLNETAKNLFGEVDRTVSENGVKNLVDFYSRITSGKMFFILILCILGSIGLLMLINWSLVKWAKVIGIDLTVMGSMLILLYILVSVIKIFITKAGGGEEEFTKLMSTISFTGLLVRGIIALVLGITLIVLYNIYKNKKFLVKKEKQLVTPEANIENTVNESVQESISDNKEEVKEETKKDVDIL